MNSNRYQYNNKNNNNNRSYNKNSANHNSKNFGTFWTEMDDCCGNNENNEFKNPYEWQAKLNEISGVDRPVYPGSTTNNIYPQIPSNSSQISYPNPYSNYNPNQDYSSNTNTYPYPSYPNGPITNPSIDPYPNVDTLPLDENDAINEASNVNYPYFPAYPNYQYGGIKPRPPIRPPPPSSNQNIKPLYPNLPSDYKPTPINNFIVNNFDSWWKDIDKSYPNIAPVVEPKEIETPKEIFKQPKPKDEPRPTEDKFSGFKPQNLLEGESLIKLMKNLPLLNIRFKDAFENIIKVLK